MAHIERGWKNYVQSRVKRLVAQLTLNSGLVRTAEPEI